jgi:hypothetical protein
LQYIEKKRPPPATMARHVSDVKKKILGPRPNAPAGLATCMLVTINCNNMTLMVHFTLFTTTHVKRELKTG